MQSIWERTAFSTRSDFIVVGAGIVGLFAALFIKRRHPGQRVVVLERGPYPSGATARNAGFACFGSPSELLHDIEAEGADAALTRAEERWRGLHELRAELGDAAIGFEASGGHEVFRSGDRLYPRVAEEFDRLNDLLRPITGTTTYRWEPTRIAGFGLAGVDHLARTDLEGALDSGELLRALLQKAAEAGVEVRCNALVTEIVESPGEVLLPLLDGTAWRGARVLVATNGYTPALLPALDVVPARGQVLITEPIPGLALHGTFHMDEGFYYFRDCAGGVLLGGGRHLDLNGERTAEEGCTPRIQGALERLLADLILPGRQFKVAYRWSGTMAFGAHGKAPLVKPVAERVAVAVRLGGMGIAIGIRVARKAVELLI
ncbi:MAG TPA: FAD-dependent oxidoreductase [Flavobacteriales bacterium]|nr:FAD-dependent oxidoreductase [Flavobacteriales bacterium]